MVGVRQEGGLHAFLRLQPWRTWQLLGLWRWGLSPEQFMPWEACGIHSWELLPPAVTLTPPVGLIPPWACSHPVGKRRGAGLCSNLSPLSSGSIYKKAGLGKEKREVTYLVAKKGVGRRVRRPAGVKGHFKVVDSRMKKDMRAQKGKEKTKRRRK